MANLVEAAVEAGKIANDSEERDWLEQELMNLCDSKTSFEPSILGEIRRRSKKDRCVYKMAPDLNLIKVNDIAKNIS